MPYGPFTTIAQAKVAFGLTTVEGDCCASFRRNRGLPQIALTQPSQSLIDSWVASLPIVATSGSEKRILKT